MDERYNKREKKSKKDKKEGSSLITKLLLKIIFSPLIFFVAGYVYYDQDFRRGVLVALIAYTLITSLSILGKFFGVLFSAATFSPFKAVFKSIEIVIMVGILIAFWFVYSLVFSSDFTL